jgi:RNA polymerase sigma-70 factor (ECF subfamily)
MKAGGGTTVVTQTLGRPERSLTDAGRTTASPSGGSFDEVVLPHLDAAIRLARRLMPNPDDADDAVQDALLRALRYFRTFTGGNGRAWFLRIVRNTCWTWRGIRTEARTDPFDEEHHSQAPSACSPEVSLFRNDAAALLDRAMSALPDRLRELLVRRELDGLSYRELADAMGMPIGTVMSGLSRARQALRAALTSQLTARGDSPPIPRRRAAATRQAASDEPRHSSPSRIDPVAPRPRRRDARDAWPPAASAMPSDVREYSAAAGDYRRRARAACDSRSAAVSCT